MPVYIACSSCGRKLRVRTDLAGRTIRCPGCQARFIAQPIEGGETPSGTDSVSAEADAGPTTPQPGSGTQPPATDDDAPTARRAVEAPVPEVLARAVTAAPAQPRVAVPQPEPVPEEPVEKAPSAPPIPTPFEMPAPRVFLVLGLVLLLGVLLGLAGAWWVSAGMRGVTG